MTPRPGARSAVGAALCLALAGGCHGGQAPAPDAERIAAATASAVAAGPGASVSLASVVAGEWRRVHVFGPYTTTDRLERCLGGDVPAGLARGIGQRDDVSLLVFEYADAAPRSVALPRAAGDFGPEAVDRSYSREAAAFVVREPPAGSWGELVPAHAPPRRCA